MRVYLCGARLVAPTDDARVTFTCYVSEDPSEDNCEEDAGIKLILHLARNLHAVKYNDGGGGKGEGRGAPTEMPDKVTGH